MRGRERDIYISMCICLCYSATYRDVLLETFVQPHPTAHGKTAQIWGSSSGMLLEYWSSVLSTAALARWRFRASLVMDLQRLPSGKPTKNYGKSQLFMGKSTINGHFQ